MALEKINEIDVIGIDKITGEVQLSLLDEFDWNDENYHLKLLQDKLNYYLSFIESGEIYSEYPKSKGRKIEIKIILKYDIPFQVKKIIREGMSIVSEAGINISLEVWRDGEP